MRQLFVLAAICMGLAGPIAAQISAEARAFYEQGLAGNRSGHLVEATTAFTNALTLDPEFAEAYYQRGLAFDGMGRRQQAVDDYAAAVGRGIQTLEPYLRLIAIYKENQLYPAALIVTDQILAHLPENAAGAYWDKGQIYQLMGDRPNAIAAYEACIAALGPTNADFAATVRDRIAALQ